MCCAAFLCGVCHQAHSQYESNHQIYRYGRVAHPFLSQLSARVHTERRHQNVGIFATDSKRLLKENCFVAAPRMFGVQTILVQLIQWDFNISEFHALVFT
jgi:hypothetical protein